MVDLRSVHTVDTAPDNPWANTMLEDDNVVRNITTSPCWSAWLRIETNITNEREGNTSRQIEVDDPDIIPIVEYNLTSIRGSDGWKSESAFAKVEYEDEDPVPFNEEPERWPEWVNLWP